MWGLALKDFYTGKKDILLYGGFILLLSIVFFIPWSADAIDYAGIVLPVYKLLSIFLIFLCLGAIQQGFLAGDEQKGFQYYVSATPLLSAGVVRERYLMNLFSTMALAAYCYLITTLQAALSGQSCGEDYIILFLFYAHLFLAAIELPFYLRFGMQCGQYLKTGMLLIFLFILSAFFLYGDFGRWLSMDDFIAWCASLDMETVIENSIVLCSLIPWGILLCYYVSYRISCKLYQKALMR